MDRTGAGLGLEWRGALALLSSFACLLAAVGGRSGRCEGCELCNCFLGYVGMLRRGAHLQLPTLGFSTKPLASVTIQEWYESGPKGPGVSLEITARHKPSRIVSAAQFLRVSRAPPTLHLIPVGCGSLRSPPTPGRRSWSRPERPHSRNDSTPQGENRQPAAEK